MQTDSRFPACRALDATLSGPIAGGLSETPISEVAMSVFGDPEVVPLWFGEGDLVTPDFVRDAAAKGLQAGETFYTWQRGIPELRAALVGLYRAALRHQMSGRPADGHDRRHAGDPAVAASFCSIPATTS